MSDAGADPKVNEWESKTSDLTESDSSKSETRAAAFSDLRELEMKLASDFGAEVSMRWEEFHVASPSPAEFGDVPIPTVFRGVIENLPVRLKDGSDERAAGAESDDVVTILYIKAAYDFEQRLRRSSTFIDAEKLTTSSFPHETTGEQFYSEQKVLAYRALAREMVRANRGLFAEAVAKVKATCDRDFSEDRDLSEDRDD